MRAVRGKLMVRHRRPQAEVAAGIRRLIRGRRRGRTVRAAIGHHGRPTRAVPGRARHGIKLLLLFRSEQGANLRFPTPSSAPSSWRTGLPATTTCRPQRLALRSVFLKMASTWAACSAVRPSARLYFARAARRGRRAPSRRPSWFHSPGRQARRGGGGWLFIRARATAGRQREAGGR